MDKDCVFCQIIAGRRKADIVFQDETLLVFKDTNPRAPVHLLIVPRKHIRSINEVTEVDEPLMAALITGAKGVAKTVGIDRSGYRLVFNVERGAGQVVFHVHLHLMGGWHIGTH
jgi:histidine triad (HIT) family protein